MCYVYFCLFVFVLCSLFLVLVHGPLWFDSNKRYFIFLVSLVNYQSILSLWLCINDKAMESDRTITYRLQHQLIMRV